MKTAFVFSGQGAQYPGMGQELYKQYSIVRDTYEEASKIVGYDMTELCFAENDRLNQTEYTQPAILTTSIAFYRVLKEKGFTPEVVAGLSLGEYSALVASGALSFSDAVALVTKRGRFMTEAAPAGTGKMVAIMNAERTLIEEACQQASSLGIVSPANYNTPAQIVIGGETESVDKACDILKEAGVKRMIPLNVSGPFHTALLKPASDKLHTILKETPFAPLQLSVVSNTTAKVMKDDEIVDLLTKQVMTGVRWEDSIVNMKNLGVDTIIEVGPGKVLSGFIKKIDKTIATSRVEDEATLNETITLLESGN